MVDWVKSIIGVAVLIRFLANQQVSMPEAVVYSSILTMAAVFFCLEMYLSHKERERKDDTATQNSVPMEQMAKDVAELKHKMNAETLQKGFRLK